MVLWFSIDCIKLYISFKGAEISSLLFGSFTYLEYLGCTIRVSALYFLNVDIGFFIR